MTTTRPTVRGYGGAVAAGHHLAAQIGAQELARGGNAADAACAMGFALWVLEPTRTARRRSASSYATRANACSRSRARGPRRPRRRASAPGFALLPLDGLVSACVPARSMRIFDCGEFGTRHRH
jgi:gamma-glutamyltranspeptidase/glutathione hydrolase